MFNELQAYTTFFQHCRHLRNRLRGVSLPHINSLYWYDRPFAEIISWRGFLGLIGWRFKQRHRDLKLVNRDYEFKSVYFANTLANSSTSTPTVWDSRSLSRKPWHGESTPITRALEENAPQIIKEFEQIQDLIILHPESVSLTSSGKWNALFLFGVNGKRNSVVADRCPVTMRVIEALPICRNFGFVMFSHLEPHTHVTPHSGSSNLRLRHHLGIVVPEPTKTRIRVGNEARQWEVGKCIAFDDSFEHEVYHDGDLSRVVLSVDIWHPDLSAADIEFLSDPVFRNFGRISL